MNTDNNKLLADFMGAKYNKDVSFNIEKNDLWLPKYGICNFQLVSTGKRLKYHCSWNWLMPVVEKIENTSLNNDYIDFHIMPDAVIVTNQENENNPLILINKSEGMGSIETEPILFEDKICSVYWACVLFVKWYNEQNKYK